LESFELLHSLYEFDFSGNKCTNLYLNKTKISEVKAKLEKSCSTQSGEKATTEQDVEYDDAPSSTENTKIPSNSSETPGQTNSSPSIFFKSLTMLILFLNLMHFF
jgi:ATP-dependent Zn protease